MSTKEIKEKAETKKNGPKELMQKEIVLVISTALTSLKEKLGEKKFEKRIKKAAKLLTEGIKPVITKKAAVKKTTETKPGVAKPKVASPAKKTAKKVAEK